MFFAKNSTNIIVSVTKCFFWEKIAQYYW
jgi:hypothetical protein